VSEALIKPVARRIRRVDLPPECRALTMGPIKDAAELERFRAELARLLRTARLDDKVRITYAMTALIDKYHEQKSAPSTTDAVA
jgi:hypothetical protein